MGKEYEKSIEKLKDNTSDLEKNIDRLNTLMGKIQKDYEKSIDYSVPDDLDTNLIQSNIQAINKHVGNIKERIAQLDTLRSNSNFNRVFADMDYINRLLLYNENYIRVNSYSTAEWVAEIDSIVKLESNHFLKLVKDSIPMEIMEKELLDELKSIDEICKTAKTELNQLKAENKIKYPYKYELYLQAIYADAIRITEQAHRKSINFDQEVYKALKSGKGDMNQVESRMKKQPDLKEKNYEYIAKLTEKEHERRVKYMDLINKETKKWKDKYSGK
jgi:hypothetical protein